MKRYLIVGLISISLFFVGGHVAESANNGPGAYCAGDGKPPIEPGTIKWFSFMGGEDTANPIPVSYLWSADGNTNQSYIKKYSLPQNAQVSFAKTNGIKMTASKNEFSCYPCTSNISSWSCPGVVYRECKVYAEGGYNSDGSFSNQVAQLVSEANSKKEYGQIGFSGTAANNSADAVGERLTTSIGEDLGENYRLKILVVAHSLGAVGTFNAREMLDGNGVSYLLYDPPYNEYWSNTCPTWAPNCFEFIGNAQAIERAKNGGIATSGHVIDWTKGTTKPLACHMKYKTNPESLNAVKTWLNANCMVGNKPGQATPQPGSASNYSFNVVAVGGGTVRASGPAPECAGDPISAPVGGSKTFNIGPNSGNYLSSLYIDGNFYSKPPTNGFPYTFSNVKTNHYIYAIFSKTPAPSNPPASTTPATTTPSIPNYRVTATVSGAGTISPSGAVIIPKGTSKTFTFTPATNYTISYLYVDGKVVPNASTYTFSNVQNNHTIKVSYKALPSTDIPTPPSVPDITPPDISDPVSYKISTTVNSSGTVSPNGLVSVTKGASKTFTFTPNSGYRVAYVAVDNQPLGTPSSYTFSNIQADHALRVTFGVIPVATTTKATTTSANSTSTSALSTTYSQVANVLSAVSRWLEFWK